MTGRLRALWTIATLCSALGLGACLGSDDDDDGDVCRQDCEEAHGGCVLDCDDADDRCTLDCDGLLEECDSKC